MTEYLITITGDETVWDARTDDERRAVGEAHRDFAAALTARGHRAVVGGELTPLARAKVVRRSAAGVIVTDGPYAEATSRSEASTSSSPTTSTTCSRSSARWR